MNAELSGGRNALHFAADYGQADVIQCLLDAGADVNVCTQDWYSLYWLQSYNLI